MIVLSGQIAMGSPIPFEIMATATIIWTLLAAFIIAPLMVWKKIKKHGATPENIKRDVVEDLKMEMYLMEVKSDTKIQDFREDITKQISAIEPPEIPDLDLKQLYEDIKVLMAEDINILQENLPTIIINSLHSEDGQKVLLEAAKSSVQSIEGAIYRKMGIDKERAEKGVQMTKEWFLDNIEKVKHPKSERIAAFKNILAQIFPDAEEDWVDEKIAAIKEIQILLGPPPNGNQQHTPSFGNIKPTFGNIKPKKGVIPSGGMFG